MTSTTTTSQDPDQDHAGDRVAEPRRSATEDEHDPAPHLPRTAFPVLLWD